MDKARDQQGVTGTEFTKQAHHDRPASSASNKTSQVDVNSYPFYSGEQPFPKRYLLT